MSSTNKTDETISHLLNKIQRNEVQSDGNETFVDKGEIRRSEVQSDGSETFVDKGEIRRNEVQSDGSLNTL